MGTDGNGIDLSQFPEPPPYAPDFAWIGDMQKSERVDRERQATRRREQRNRLLHPFKRESGESLDLDLAPVEAPETRGQFPAPPPYEPDYAWIGDMQRSEGPKPARKWLWFKRRQHTSVARQDL